MSFIQAPQLLLGLWIDAVFSPVTGTQIGREAETAQKKIKKGTPCTKTTSNQI